jgi:hypothetical protein
MHAQVNMLLASFCLLMELGTDHTSHHQLSIQRVVVKGSLGRDKLLHSSDPPGLIHHTHRAPRPPRCAHVLDLLRPPPFFLQNNNNTGMA